MIYVYPFQQSKQHEGKTSLLTADLSNHKSPCFVLFYQESGKISIIQQLHYLFRLKPVLNISSAYGQNTYVSIFWMEISEQPEEIGNSPSGTPEAD